MQPLNAVIQECGIRMLILDINDLDNYRYAIAKAVFLKQNQNCELIADEPESNYMKVRMNGQPFIVSMFRKPVSAPPESWYFENEHEIEIPIRIYYQRKPRNASDKESGENSERLSQEFNSEYQDVFQRAFENPEQLREDLGKYYSPHLESLFCDENFFHEKGFPLFKYYSEQTICRSNRSYAILNNGALSFSHPNTFNDPFDCTCYFPAGNSAIDYFRVLCMTKKNDNILMWSYYGENHKGYCLEYDVIDIVKKIRSISDIRGICLVGDVRYRDKRPAQRLPSNRFSYSYIKYYAEATFTKFIEWEHEREYRFVIFSPDFAQNNTDFAGRTSLYYVINSKVINIFAGVNSGANNPNIPVSKRFQMDPADYKLI
jgi:hypothetical protein